ncbi:2-amino-4-hydroxy-6-hydroxymethyldihydropteridinediphosphokinase [Peptoclostridium litorale DSM 5388]|uniref:2-amino-4-hydroxy-6-hydroxymethyldihydropteridine diphosphokinase n=1 Tax=Peptoclostridium litorale DSM 5388 TaxID=1121324 RepID=A0A069RDZ3_PEPLI|nr:2-amino-4-hydroxy-6-hydroxymethyldihydropteridine diphosphokinase [Peptoclostridium litorale]KDR94420.1 bifunctional folate synthesis protein SulD [Peptoclostridium litorale DSM 5388]SIO24193.1 2-amino-4-hydroxy-6-hydroxymethyldihydropteridinediphosphokinase [Peptoclostridium litorale DSM 5388]
MADAFISLGSNMGDRLLNLKNAIEKIQGLEDTNVLSKSSVYETEPWGLEEQDSFLNMCINIETGLSPRELLQKLLGIESELGRKRIIRWGPRTIDLDILIYDDISVEEEDLLIPHPRISERAFVLMPLEEIAAGMTINGRSIDYWLKKASNQGIAVYEKE